MRGGRQVKRREPAWLPTVLTLALLAFAGPLWWRGLLAWPVLAGLLALGAAPLWILWWMGERRPPGSRYGKP